MLLLVFFTNSFTGSFYFVWLTRKEVGLTGEEHQQGQEEPNESERTICRYDERSVATCHTTGSGRHKPQRKKIAETKGIEMIGFVHELLHPP